MTSDRQALRRALEFLRLPGNGLVEIAAFDQRGNHGGPVASGLFNNLDDAVDAATDLDAEGKFCVYAGINPLDPQEGRQVGCLQRGTVKLAGERSVHSVQSLLVDLDPRSTKRPATNSEVVRCEAAARGLLDQMDGYGAAALLRTGSGCALWFRVDLPTGDESKQLHRNFLRWAGEVLEDHKVEVDLAVSNQNRLTALPGTTKRKLKGQRNFTRTRPPRRVEIVEICDGQGEIESFLRSLHPRGQHPTADDSATMADRAGGEIEDLCPGWLAVYRTIGSAAGSSLPGDWSASGVSFRLVGAMIHRTEMTEEQIIEALDEWDDAHEQRYGTSEDVANDVRRMITRGAGLPPCSDIHYLLADQSPCEECPEWRFRIRRSDATRVIVRKHLPPCTRPSTREEGASRPREALGADLSTVRDGLDEMIELDGSLAFKYADRPTDRGYPTVLMRAGAGAGKTTTVVDVLERLLARGGEAFFGARPPGNRFIYFTESYRTALDVRDLLADRSVPAELFHPKLSPPNTPGVAGWCEDPERLRAARNRGVLDERREVCEGCPLRDGCAYWTQYRRNVSYIAVHDLAGALVGARPGRRWEELPQFAVFDEAPTRAYMPQLVPVADEDFDQLDRGGPDCVDLANRVYALHQEQRSSPQPVFDLLTAPLRREWARLVERLEERELGGIYRRLLDRLGADLGQEAPPYRVWVAPNAHPFRDEDGREAPLALCEARGFRVDPRVLAIVLDATGDPRILRAGLGRRVVVDTDALRPDCEVLQVPWETTRREMSRPRGVCRRIHTFLDHLANRHDEDNPLGLISYASFTSGFFEKRDRAGYVTSHFGGLRGSNEFVVRGVKELVIVGAPVPNLTSFAAQASVFVERHEGRAPETALSSWYVDTGASWRGLKLGTRHTGCPDPLAGALFDQQCAAELYQAAFRVRPLDQPETKKIWIFGQQPVWDLPTTRLLTMEDAFAEIGVRRPKRSPGPNPDQKQRAVEFVERYRKQHGRPPTKRQIMEGVSVSESTAKRAKRENRRQRGGAEQP